MKFIATTLSLIFVFSIALECQAQRAKKREGQQPQEKRQGAPEPTQMAAKMLEQFDTNGDMKLDESELTAMFTSMRERRGQQGPGNRRRGEGRMGPGEDNPAGEGGKKQKRRGNKNKGEKNLEDPAEGGAEGKAKAKGEGRKRGKKRGQGGASEDNDGA